MKLVSAYVRVFMVPKVVQALRKENCRRVTAIDVSAITEPLWQEEAATHPETGLRSHMVKLEIICPEPNADAIVEAIRKAAKTGNPGDGIIAVLPLDSCIGIRTGKLNEHAI